MTEKGFKKGNIFPFFCQMTSQRPKKKFGGKIFSDRYMLPALGRIAYAIPLNREPCPLPVRTRGLLSLPENPMNMNHVRKYIVLLLAGICLLGCRSSRYSRRDIDTVHVENERKSTNALSGGQTDTHLFKVQEIDGSWWAAHIKFDTSALPDSLGRYPVSEVNLQGSLSQAKIHETTENHSEDVEIVQEEEERDGITDIDMEESATIEPVHGRYGVVALVLLLLTALLYIIHQHPFSHAQRNTSK